MHNTTETDPPGSGKKKWPSKRRMTILIGVIAFAVILFVVLNNFGSVGGALSKFFRVFTPFVYGMAIAYLFNMSVRFFEQRVFHRHKKRKTLSIIVTYAMAIAVIVFLLWQIIPQITSSAVTLYTEMPTYMENLRSFSNTLAEEFGVAQETMDNIYRVITDIVQQAGAWLNDTLPSLVRNVVGSVGTAILTGIASIIASIYMLANKEKLLLQCKRVLYAFAPKKKADECVRVGRLSDRIFSGFISGKLIVSLIMGTICFVFMSILNLVYSLTGISWLQMPYALLVSVVIGITNIIPYFGPFIGTIPVLFIMVMISPGSALLFLLFILVLQQVDNNLISPRVVGKSIGLPALWVFAGTIVGGGLFGLTGMLLGAPATAVLYVLCGEIVAKRLLRRGLSNIFIEK